MLTALILQLFGELDSYQANKIQFLRSHADKIISGLKGMNQNKIDSILDEMSTIPGASNFVGSVKDKVISANKRAKTELNKAKQQSVELEKDAADIHNRIDDLSGSGIALTLDPEAKKKRKAIDNKLTSMEQKYNFNLVENKA